MEESAEQQQKRNETIRSNKQKQLQVLRERLVKLETKKTETAKQISSLQEGFVRLGKPAMEMLLTQLQRIEAEDPDRDNNSLVAKRGVLYEVLWQSAALNPQLREILVMELLQSGKAIVGSKTILERGEVSPHRLTPKAMPSLLSVLDGKFAEDKGGELSMHMKEIVDTLFLKGSFSQNDYEPLLTKLQQLQYWFPLMEKPWGWL